MAGKNWDDVPGFDRKREQYVRLDLNAWIAQNRIEEEGERQGKLNQPPGDANDLDATESNIVAWVNSRARACRTDVTNHLADLERDLATADIDENLEAHAQHIATEARDAALAIANVARTHRNQLAQSRSLVERAAADMREFRIRARLGNRLPDYEHRSSALWVIISCFAVEVALNAGLLMEVNAFGLVGAALQMAIISAVNIFVFGLAMGGLVRQLHDVALGRKAAAVLAIGLLIPLALVFNLAVGHFRDSMEAILTDPAADVFAVGTDALGQFAANPIGLDSFQSWMLAFVGFLFFCVASWKWLDRDDVYPGYGARDRRFQAVQERFKADSEKAHTALRNTYDQAKSQLDDQYHQVLSIAPKTVDVQARARKIVADYRTHLDQYNLDVAFLLAAYRTANRNVRTEPCPAHFDARQQVHAAILETPSFEPPTGKDLSRVFDSLDGATSTLQAKYDEAIASIPTLDELLQRGAEPSAPAIAVPDPAGGGRSG